MGIVDRLVQDQGSLKEMLKATHGERWLRSAFDGVEFSPLGMAVAGLLDTWLYGIYHGDVGHLRKMEWDNSYHIEMPHYGPMATFDDDNLTRLVLLAHDRCVRVQIEARSSRYLTIRFHPRVRSGDGHRQLWERHPDLDEMIERFAQPSYDGG